jgi:hypothetical protein
MKTKRVKLGSAVCAFCEHCIAIDKHDGYASECLGDYSCRLSKNQRVCHPITGQAIYIYIEEKPVDEKMDLITGDGVFKDQEEGRAVKLDVDYTEDEYRACYYLNQWGKCKDYKRISEKGEKERFGKSSDHESFPHYYDEEYEERRNKK